MLTLRGTEASLSYVQCFLYVVSSSTNASIFHITWLDTFWTDICLYNIISISYVYIHTHIGIYKLADRIRDRQVPRAAGYVGKLENQES